MTTVNSLSGGKTSSFIAAHYPADYNLFALVRIEDERCRFKDEHIRRQVEDRIQAPFIATAEDDTIIYTMLDLEQYIGRPIHWVTGETYDEVCRTRGGWLPNKLHRYCTTALKIEPMFYWSAAHIGVPVEMRIGFRANEQGRAAKMLGKCNAEGLLEFEASFGTHLSGPYCGKRKWETVAWQKPVFPLIEQPTYKDTIEKYWRGKPVRFAELNNCVGCFHRSPQLLCKMFQKHPAKMNWFAEQEMLEGKGTWRSDASYAKIMEYGLQFELGFEDITSCDEGFCESA